MDGDDAAIMRLADSAVDGASEPQLRELAAQTVRDVLHVKFGTVVKYTADNKAIETASKAGWSNDSDPTDIRMVTPEPRFYQALREAGHVVIKDWRTQPASFKKSFLTGKGMVSSLDVAIPQMGQDTNKLWGVIAAHTSEPRAFTSADVKMLRRMAYILSYAMQYAYLLARERESAMLVRAASRAARIGGWEVRPDLDQAVWSEETCALHGMPAKRTTLSLAEAGEYMGVESQSLAMEVMGRLLRDGKPFDEELQIRTRQGQDVWVRAVGEPVRDDDGRVVYARGAVQDITREKNARAEMDFLAYHDVLTQLPNRRLLEIRARQAIALCRHTNQTAAFMLLDLDRFKMFNDALGHRLGDRLLQSVAERLVQLLDDDDTVARLGADEFVLLVGGLDADADCAMAQVRRLGERVLTGLAQPYDLAGQEYVCTQSLGLTLIGAENSDYSELLKQVDLSMHAAKAQGRNRMRMFDPSMQAEVKARTILEYEMRSGMQKDQFRAHYQAQVNHSGALTGAEVLVRWQHPRLGLLKPGRFIAIAEQSGLIQDLGMMVLEKACRQLVRWADSDRTRMLTLSVNVSARQFRHPHFVADIRRVIEQTGANPERLILELTETSLLHDVDDIAATMRTIRELGVTFSLDDFGTGYSSMYYLKHLPLAQLKIDKSFVRGVHDNAGDASIVRTILALGDALGLDVIAEGVEEDDEHRFLEGAGCQAFQGFLFSRPGPIDDFEHHWRLC